MPGIQEALAPFVWGQGGQQLSPADVARKRQMAEALLGKNSTPKNVGEGLSRVGEALLYNSLNSRAADAERTGMERATELFTGLQDGSNDMSELMGALSDPYLQQNPGQSAVAQALLQQQMQQQDPAYQLGLEKDRLTLEQMRNPEYEAPQIVETYDPETGRPVKGYMTPNGFEPVGGVAAPKDPLVTVNTGDMAGEGKAFYEALDKDNAQMFSTLQQDGVNAGSALIKIDRMDELLSQVDTGAGAAFSQIAGNLGIQTEGLGEIQAAQALINQLVPAQRPAGSGPMSDADLELFKQSLPRIINQPGGNKIIIDTMRGITQYTTAQGAIADKVANREISPAEGRKLLRELENPLEKIADISKQTEPGPDVAPEGFENPELWKYLSPEERALWQ